MIIEACSDFFFLIKSSSFHPSFNTFVYSTYVYVQVWVTLHTPYSISLCLNSVMADCHVAGL